MEFSGRIQKNGECQLLSIRLGIRFTFPIYLTNSYDSNVPKSNFITENKSLSTQP